MIHLCWKILFLLLALTWLEGIEFPAHGRLTVPGQFGTETTIDWCGCGSPSQIVRGSNTAAPETTSFQFNLHGAVTKGGLASFSFVTSVGLMWSFFFNTKETKETKGRNWQGNREPVSFVTFVGLV